MTRTISLFILLISTLKVTGQDPGLARELDFEKLADEIFAQQDLDLNYEELYENLSQRLSNPLNINTATKEELQGLFILKEAQINELIAYRKNEGEFISMYELQSVPTFDPSIIRKLSPFVTVVSGQVARRLVKRIFSEENNYLLVRDERSLNQYTGYDDETDSVARYRGAPDKLYSRLRVSHAGDFSFGVTAEKDAGEPLEWNRRRRGFDHYAVHGQLMNNGAFKNIIIGDYQAQFGQGLVLGGGLAMGKGSETIMTIRRNTIGFTPYTSVSESGFFRGSAVSVALRKRFWIHTFVSRIARDANVSADSTSATLLESGLHRNAREEQDFKQLTETNAGVALEYRSSLAQGGVLFHRAAWDVPIIKPMTVYNQFEQWGKEITNVSAFGTYSHNNISFFGEFAHTIDAGKGMLAGILASLSKNFDVSVLLRRYDRDFKTVYGNALAENSTLR